MATVTALELEKPPCGMPPVQTSRNPLKCWRPKHSCTFTPRWPLRSVRSEAMALLTSEKGRRMLLPTQSAAGGNISPNGVSMFEPIGGTAPDHVGRGTINPLAAIAALEMLLDTIGETAAARRVDSGIRLACSKMASMRAGEMGYSTSEVGDLVVEGATA